MYRLEPPLASASIYHSNSPNVPSPIGTELHATASDGYADVGINHISPDKDSSYTYEQAHHNIKAEHGYQSHYNIPPVVFVPSTSSQSIPTTEVTGAIHENNTTSSSPIQIQNVGTIIAENNEMLHNSSIATVPKYADCHTPSTTNSTINNNICTHHSPTNSIHTNDTNGGQHGNTFNPLR